MINIGIVGVSGYSGMVLLETLLKHPNVRVAYVSAQSTTGKIKDIWPQLNTQTDLECVTYDPQVASKNDCVFLALPHTVAMDSVPALLAKGVKVIDLSGDYRLKNTDDYKKWYGLDHKDAANLKNAVYGLPELYREDIKKATLLSNPGCYPTAAILGLAPAASTLTNDIESIIIDAKSGVSGAGRKAALNLNFCEVNENFKAYKVLNHQHAPEIDLYLSKFSQKSFPIRFVPHLLPINRGILETIYINLSNPTDLEKIHKVYERFYKTEPFVRVLELGKQPEIKDVVKTNYCDLGLSLSADGKCLVVTSVIDNLVKGAAGQAIQNMNIMFNFKETESLC